jgi:hypothetical protein
VIEREIQFDASTIATHYDGAGLVPTSATCQLVGTQGEVISSPTVSISTVSTTVSAATTLTLTLGSVTGVQVGAPLRVTSDGITYVVEVAKVDGTTITLADPLPVAVDASSPVKGLLMTCTVAAPGSAAIGTGLRLVWQYTDGTTTKTHADAVVVVRWPWVSPVTPEDVRGIMADTFRQKADQQLCTRIANRVSDKIKAALIQSGRRPSMYLSPDVFRPAAEAGIRYALAEDGIILGSNVYEAQRETRFAFHDQLTQAIQGQVIDRDGDGKLSSSELKPMGNSFRVTR